MSKGITWKGIDEFSEWLKTQPAATVKDVEAALFQEGELVMARSVRRTPVDHGPLRASAHVKRPETTGGKTTVTLAYGTDYAVYVHEITTAQHEVGRSKFLESSMRDAEKVMMPRLKKRVLDRIAKRGGL